MDTLTPKQAIFDLVQKDFSFSLKDRLSIWADVDKYHWKEDESVWNQKRGNSALGYEVHFDGEFVCFFDTGDSETSAYIKVLEGIKDLYSKGKIHWNKEMYEFDKPEERKIEIDAPDSPEDHILTEVVKKQAKKKNIKVVTKKRYKNASAQ